MKRLYKFSDFLKNREDRIKPKDIISLGLNRIDKINFEGIIYLSDKGSNTDMILVKPGDLVISGINVEKGAVAVYEGTEDVLATIHYSSYQYDSSIIDIEYLKLFIKSPQFKKLIISATNGGIKTEVKPKHLLPLEITLPDVIDQQKVVTKINEALKTNKLLQEIQTSQINYTNRLKLSILQGAIQGKLVAQDPKDEPAQKLIEKLIERRINKNNGKHKIRGISDNRKYEIDNQFSIPNNWAWTVIDKISQVSVGATPDRSNSTFWKGKYNWISSGEVANNIITISRETISDVGLKNSSVKIYPKNTVLVAMIGQGKTRGQTSILDIEAGTNQNVAGLILDNDYIVSKYIWYFFLSRYVKTREPARGGNQPALNGKIIGEISIPIPPINEQKRIVEKVESLLRICDDQEKNIIEAKENTSKLNQSILREMFE